MAQVIYPETAPRRYDTRLTTLGKTLQAINDGAGGSPDPTPEVSIAAGFYTQSGGNNAYTGTVSGSPVTGDIIAVAIASTGDRAEITIKGKATGGTYATGLGVDNEPSAAKIVFTVVSMGFDNTGTATTLERTVYGTKFVRKVTPDEAQADETTSGSDVIVRVWLSDIIYQKDLTGSGVTNSSTVAYQKVIGNWTWPPFQRLTGASHDLRCCCFHRHGQSGRPVRVVRFYTTDGTNTPEAFVTAPIIDAGMADQSKVIEYKGTVSNSTLTQAAECTSNFSAYPWVGDADSVLHSSTGAALPSPLIGPQKHLCDKNGTYGVTMARVSTTGSDAGANTVYDSAVYDPATAYQFATIGKAADAIEAYNNTNRSRADVGAGIIELEAGSYAWLGSSNTYGTTPKCWITIRAKTGVARASVIVASQSGNTDISDRVQLQNVTITVATANTFDPLAIWFDQCEFNTTGTGILTATAQYWWLTHCKVTQLAQGLRPANNLWNQAPALVRGCDLTGFTRSIVSYTVVGNKKTTSYVPATAMFITDFSTGQIIPQPVNFIIAFNEIYGFQNAAGLISTGSLFANAIGGAVVQNVLEVSVGTGSVELADFASSDGTATNTPLDNFIIWHNTLVGQRCFFGYNDAGSTTKFRRYWSQIGNYVDRWANKGDTYAPANAARIGAWQVTNNVGSRGNQLAQCMVSLPNNFFAEFDGINCHEPAASETAAYAQFVDRKSYDGTSNGAGDGNYRTQAGSPLRNFCPILVLPYDIEGNARTIGRNDAGAFTSP